MTIKLENLVRDNYLEGQIKSIPMESMVDFYKENEFKFSPAGLETFLKAVKIPHKYFLQQPDETRIELLENQVDIIRGIKSMYGKGLFYWTTSADTTISYVVADSLSGLQANLEKTPVNPSWIYLEDNIKDGYRRYFYTKEKIENDKYVYGVFIDYPILYSKPMYVQCGYYILPTEGDLEFKEIFIPEARIKLKTKELPETTHSIYLDNLFDETLPEYGSVVKDLETNWVGKSECMVALERGIESEMAHVGTLHKVHRYVEKNNLQFEYLLGMLETMYLFNTELKSFGARQKYKNGITDCVLKKAGKFCKLIVLEGFKSGY